MGFFSNLISATVKTALTPLAVVKDAVSVATGNEPDATKDLLKSAGKDLSDVIENVEEELG